MREVNFHRRPWGKDRQEYDGAWPVEYGYDPLNVSKYVAEELAPYIIGFTACPNFKFDKRIGSCRSRAIKTDDIDEAIRQCILEFKKYPGTIVLYDLKILHAVDPDDFTPVKAYKVRYARLSTHEEELAWQERFIGNET